MFKINWHRGSPFHAVVKTSIRDTTDADQCLRFHVPHGNWFLPTPIHQHSERATTPTVELFILFHSNRHPLFANATGENYFGASAGSHYERYSVLLSHAGIHFPSHQFLLIQGPMGGFIEGMPSIGSDGQDASMPCYCCCC